MMYLLDTADLSAIQRAKDLYPVIGVTTNPSIIAKEKKGFLEIVNGIRETIGDESLLHVQTLGSTATEIIWEAEYLREKIKGKLYIKIPVTAEGIKAIRILKEQGYDVTATAIITAQQALMASVAGADFLAPYVNRIDNIGGNGVGVVRDMVELMKIHGLKSKVLAASFKNVQQVHEVSKVGAHSITVSPELMDALIAHPITNSSVEQFSRDWQNVYGIGKNMKNSC